MSGESSNAALVPKPKTVSVVWNYFGLEQDEEGKPKNDDVAICRRCKRRVQARGGNTSNLLSHLRTHHPLQHSEVVQAQKGKKRKAVPQCENIDSMLKQAQKYDRKSKRWQEITDAVTFCIAKDMLPLYSVEKQGFRRLIELLDPRYDTPSSKYFSQTAIPKLYGQTRERIATVVQGAEFFAATTDMWSSMTSEPYLSYTVHFIGEDWDLQSVCLETLYLPEDHSADNLAEAFENVLDQWQLDASKQMCVTTDNGRNVVCAVTSRLQWTHLPCFGHNLHLAVGNATKDDSRIQRALGVCKKIVTTFSHSWKKKRDLAKAQGDLSLPQHSLVTECATRWGSKQKMLQRILEQEAAIRQVLSGDRKTAHLIPKWQDVEVLESVQAAIGPLADFTDILSGEDRVTLSSVKPVLHILKERVLSVADDDTLLTTDIKTQILDYLESKYSGSDLDELLNISCFVDPRFKTEYIEDATTVAIVKDRLSKEMVEMVSEEASAATSDVTQVSETAHASEPPSKKRKLGSWLKEVKNTRTDSTTPKTTEEKAKEEIEAYLQAPSADPESNPLLWWKVHATTYPFVAKVARKYLCICASSSPSERVFSTSGHIVSKRRCSLKPDKVSMLVFLARNL